jgi:hypothetical protein
VPAAVKGTRTKSRSISNLFWIQGPQASSVRESSLKYCTADEPSTKGRISYNITKHNRRDCVS